MTTVFTGVLRPQMGLIVAIIVGSSVLLHRSALAAASTVKLGEDVIIVYDFVPRDGRPSLATGPTVAPSPTNKATTKPTVEGADVFDYSQGEIVKNLYRVIGLRIDKTTGLPVELLFVHETSLIPGGCFRRDFEVFAAKRFGDRTVLVAYNSTNIEIREYRHDRTTMENKLQSGFPIATASCFSKPNETAEISVGAAAMPIVSVILNSGEKLVAVAQESKDGTYSWSLTP
jgi:hypothetical protein